MERYFNFSAGPAALPVGVIAQIKEALFNWHNSGMSVMELSHRSDEFKLIIDQSNQDLRTLLAIPDNYKILFLQGGASLQFSAIPMNILGTKASADYLDTGHWSQKAIKEAKHFANINTVASSAVNDYTGVPDVNDWCLDPNAAYFHYTDNETIHGIELPFVPDVGDVPLVSDMSSNILTKVIDVSRYALIYAGAQKTIGIPGLTLVIVREDLLGKAMIKTPSVTNYQLQAIQNSLYNTAPTFSWYVAALVFRWLRDQGGIAEMEKVNQRKADQVYELIDNSEGFYHCKIQPEFRSRMNIPFTLKDAALEASFLKAAKSHQLVGLKGHRAVGGIRVSLYNAVSEEATQKLVAFMKTFQQDNQ